MINIDEKLNTIEKKINIKFNDKKLLKQVFVHRSYLNEHKEFDLENNERLEFLGDAVLELVVTENLYKKYLESEGVLTSWRSALVKGENLSKIAKEIGIQDCLLLSKGESNSTGKSRDLILANAFEALVGAMYIDQGYAVVDNFIKNFLLVRLKEIIDNKLFIDSKSYLQEIVQDKYKITPVYNLISEKGPDHNKNFQVGVYIGDKLIAQGMGNSKQKAEQDAAGNALQKINSKI
jgi:ribonuclease-3